MTVNDLEWPFCVKVCLCWGVHSTEAWTQHASWKNTGGGAEIMHIFMKVVARKVEGIRYLTQS